MARSVASLAVSIVARTNKFRKGMRRALKSVQRFSAGVVAMGKRVARIGATLVTLAAGGGIAALVASSVKAIDSLAKASDRLGLTTDQLVLFRLAGTLAGAAVNQLDLGIQRFTRRLAEASLGTGEAQGALRDLGFTTADLVKLVARPGKALLEVGKRLQTVTDAAQRLRISFKLFDSEGARIGTNVLPLLSRNFRGLQQEVRDLGLFINRVDASKVEGIADAFTRLRATISGIGRSTAVQLAGVLQNTLGNMTVFASSFTNTIVNAFRVTLFAAADVADEIRKRFVFGFKAIEAAQLLLIRGMTTNWVAAVGSLSAITDPLFERLKLGALLFGSDRGFNVLQGTQNLLQNIGAKDFLAGITARISEIQTELKDLADAPPLSERLFGFFEDVGHVTL